VSEKRDSYGAVSAALLECVVQTYDKPRIETNISLVYVAGLVDHLIDERKDAEERYGFYQSNVAQKDDLVKWKRLVGLRTGVPVRLRVAIGCSIREVLGG